MRFDESSLVGVWVLVQEQRAKCVGLAGGMGATGDLKEKKTAARRRKTACSLLVGREVQSVRRDRAAERD